MIFYPKTYKIRPASDNRDWLIQKGRQALSHPIPHITDAPAPLSEGGPHDYYSNGDYWWPDPASPNGLPYIRRDGETNPDNFNRHRELLRGMREDVVFLTCAYDFTRDEVFAARAAKILKEFFLDQETRMNPSLTFAQAIPGICSGRGIGIIDTLHLADIPFAVRKLSVSSHMTAAILEGLRDWFRQYLHWMFTSQNGLDEMNTENNHSVCFFMQAAAFSLFTEQEDSIRFCREQFQNVLLKQMAPDGSFPRELARTKPYNYSLFITDNLVALCHMLSSPENDLWEYETKEGCSIKKAIDFIIPYVLDKSAWPYPPDVMHFDAFPIRYSFLLFAGSRLGKREWISFFQSLPFESSDEEARRNLAVCQPLLWM